MYCFKGFILILFLSFLTGCGSLIGPVNIQNERQDFNIALQQTNDEQMLLNLVRMKYRDTNMFLEVSAVASQYSLTSNVTASGSLTNNFSNSIGLGSKIEYSEKPTISYTPLHGQSFITRLLSQVDPQTIGLLYKSGWSAERLFLLCLEDINGVKNAPRASGPTPKTPPVFKEFQNLVSLIREMQINDSIRLEVVQLAKSKSIAFALHFFDNVDKSKKKELENLLGVSGKNQYILTQNIFNDNKDEISFQTRSIREILFYLSQGIEVPESHVDKGLVTITKGSDGSVFNWKELTGDLLQIKSKKCPVPPANSYVAVRYRDYWFYIEDNDLNSKSTFGLLNQLYDLQSGDANGAAPVLTLPIGG